MGIVQQIKNRILDNFLIIILKDENGIETIRINVDVSESEKHTYAFVTTDHPIESGGEVTDHTIIKPFSITINGFISDTPLGLRKFGAAYDSLAANKDLSKNGGYRTISDEAFTKLKNCKDSEQLIEIVTGLDNYKNMKIELLEINRSIDTIGGISFTLTAKQLTFAESETVEVDIRTKDNKTTYEKQDLGKQPAKETSLLRSGLETLTGI